MYCARLRPCSLHLYIFTLASSSMYTVHTINVDSINQKFHYTWSENRGATVVWIQSIIMLSVHRIIWWWWPDQSKMRLVVHSMCLSTLWIFRCHFLLLSFCLTHKHRYRYHPTISVFMLRILILLFSWAFGENLSCQRVWNTTGKRDILTYFFLLLLLLLSLYDCLYWCWSALTWLWLLLRLTSSTIQTLNACLFSNQFICLSLF